MRMKKRMECIKSTSKTIDIDNWRLFQYLNKRIIPSENFSLATSGLRSRGFFLYEKNNISC